MLKGGCLEVRKVTCKLKVIRSSFAITYARAFAFITRLMSCQGWFWEKNWATLFKSGKDICTRDQWYVFPCWCNAIYMCILC